MAAQSKIHLPPPVSESAIKRVIKDISSLYLQHRSRISRAVLLTLFVAVLERIRSAISEQKSAVKRAAAAPKSKVSLGNGTPGEGGKRKKIELDREFFNNLFRLLKIVIPGWRSKEMRLLIQHTFFLILRTLISVYVAELDGRLVSSLVRGRGKEFLWGLAWWMGIAVPATFCNSMVSNCAIIMIAPTLIDCASSHIINANSHYNTVLGSQITYTQNICQT
jgi:ATP-binding cassette subfamily D (ALD) long-chain fatty acid import protein